MADISFQLTGTPLPSTGSNNASNGNSGYTGATISPGVGSSSEYQEEADEQYVDPYSVTAQPNAGSADNTSGNDSPDDGGGGTPISGTGNGAGPGTNNGGWSGASFGPPNTGVPQASDNSSPEIKGSGTGGPSTAASSPAQRVPSFSLDSNTGCIRLTPLLSLNFPSTLSSSDYWYASSEPGSTNGQLSTSHNFSINSNTMSFDISSTTVGTPGVIQNATAQLASSLDQYKHNYYQVFGTNQSWKCNVNAIDQESHSADYQVNNIFSGDDGTNENGWREEFLELATYVAGGDGASIFRNGITNNPAYMFTGQDPLLLQQINPGAVYNNCTNNVGAEYTITSQFDLPENSSFAFAFKIKKNYANMLQGNNASPNGLPYVRLYFGGQYAFQYDGQSAYFCPDTTGGGTTQGGGTNDPDSWNFEKIEGLNLNPYNNLVANGDHDGAIILIFECIGTNIVITNALDVGSFKNYKNQPGWGYDINKSLQNNQTSQLATFPSAPLTVGMRAVHATFSYIPIVYPQFGQIVSQNFQQENTNLSSVVGTSSDTTTLMGGQVSASINTDDSGDFSYYIYMNRSAQVDCTPALCFVDLRSQPTFSAGQTTTNQLLNVRAIDVQLGMDSQGGTITLDNTNYQQSNQTSIFPIQIDAGWNNQNSTIFKGYAIEQTNSQFTNNSTCIYTLVGADVVLTDGILINSPVYDGWFDNEAVQDILTRGGWIGDINIGGGDYQLSLPNFGVQPKFMFPSGTPALDAIRQIAIAAGMWAYVDSVGVFNYVQPFSPSQDVTPDVWTSISQYNDTTNIRNCVMVIGLTNYDSDDGVSLIFSIRKGTGLIPWNRWIIYQDAKANTQQACDAYADRLFSSYNRQRIVINGTCWGDNSIIPFGGVNPALAKDTLGLQGGNYRVLTCKHSIDADSNSGYFVTLEAEYDDGTATNSYVDWWSP